MPPDRLESWKHGPPASPNEEAVADLLKQVGDAETLSPQALHRIERSLRQVSPRPFWLGSLGLATAAVGGLAVALVVLVTVRRSSFPEGSPASATALSADKRSEQTLALNDRPPPPEAQPTEPVEAQPTEPVEAQPTEARPAEPRPAKTPLLEPKSRRERSAEKFAEPPAAWAGNLAKKEAKRPAALASPNLRLDVAAGAAAPVASSADLQEARHLKAAAPDDDSGLECRDEIARASAVLAGSSGDPEHALYTRGICKLRLGMRDAGIQDFQDYLRRFPNGRFAAGVRARLANLHAH